VLYDGLQPILTRAVCTWSGVLLLETEVGRRTRQLTTMFDAAGAFGPAHIRSRIARKQAERWAAGLIKEVRDGALNPAPETALRVIALHRDLEGNLLPPRVAAVELLNVLRATVAVSVYIVFCAHALHQYPAARLALHTAEARPIWTRSSARCVASGRVRKPSRSGSFHPQRFLAWSNDAYAFVPQGGGTSRAAAPPRSRFVISDVRARIDTAVEPV
jgi:cytochrome P450